MTSIVLFSGNFSLYPPGRHHYNFVEKGNSLLLSNWLAVMRQLCDPVIRSPITALLTSHDKSKIALSASVANGTFPAMYTLITSFYNVGSCRLVYQYWYSPDGSLNGYVDNSLSFFNVSDFRESSYPKYPLKNLPYNQSFCRSVVVYWVIRAAVAPTGETWLKKNLDCLRVRFSVHNIVKATTLVVVCSKMKKLVFEKLLFFKLTRFLWTTRFYRWSFAWMSTLIHALAHARTHSLIHSRTHARTHVLTHPYSFTRSVTHSLTYSLTCARTHSHTRSATRSLSHSPTRARTHLLLHSRKHTPTHSLSYSFTHSLSHSLSHAFTHPRTHARTHARTHSLTHSFCHSLTRARTYALNHSLIYKFTYSLTHSLSFTRARTHSLIHSSAHSYTWRMACSFACLLTCVATSNSSQVQGILRASEAVPTQPAVLRSAGGQTDVCHRLPVLCVRSREPPGLADPGCAALTGCQDKARKLHCARVPDPKRGWLR